MSEQQPDVRWAPIPPRPSRRGRNWLIAGLVIAGLVIAAVLLFFLLPREGSPEPGASGTPSPSASPTGAATLEPTPSATPTTDPVVTPPPAPDPSVETFRGQVSGWLGDASRGLDIVANNPGQDALPVLDTLQEDAQRLSDAPAPSSVSTEWFDAVSAYSQRLGELRTAVSSGSDSTAAVEAARMAVQDLNAIVGL